MKITVLGPTHITRWCKHIPFLNVFLSSEWTWEANVFWLNECIKRGDVFVVIQSNGEVFRQEIRYLSELIGDKGKEVDRKDI